MASESPRVGFVSLGCPKALVDSERTLTQPRACRFMQAQQRISARRLAARVSGKGAPRLPAGEFADVLKTGDSEYDLEARLG